MKDKESIDEVFGKLTTALYKIKQSGSILLQQSYIHNIKLEIITSKIFEFPPNTALAHLDLALKDIGEIKEANSNIVLVEPTGASADVREVAFDEEEGHEIFNEENNPIIQQSPRDIYKDELEAKKSNELNLNKIEAELNALKDKLSKRIAALETSGRNKIKLNFTVEEFGILFAAFEKNKIINIPNKRALSRLIAETFSSKDKDEFTAEKLNNSFTTFSEKSLETMHLYLTNMLKSVEQFQKKIQR